MSDIANPYDCLVLKDKRSYPLLYLRPLHHFCERCLNHPTYVPLLKDVLVSCHLSAGLRSNISQNPCGLVQKVAYRDLHPLCPLENKIQDVLALAIRTPDTELCIVSFYICFVIRFPYPLV